MMTAEIKSEELSPESGSTVGSLYQTGGHRLTSFKPVFTGDSKYLLICSGNNLRRYVVETGAFITSHHFGHQNDVISVQLMPNNSDEVMVTSNDGLVIVWNLIENRKVSEYNLKVNKNTEKMIWCQLVSNFFYFTTNLKLKKPEGQTECKIYYSQKNIVNQKRVINNLLEVNQTINSVTFCPASDPKYCVAIYKNILHVYEIPVQISSIRKKHLMNEDKQFTCVVSHPFDLMVATGDSFGRITIWHNFVDSNQPTRSVMHWHQWPVADLCFSPEGTALYSVGAESTLVRWELSANHFGEKNFMPRLGMAIKYVTVDNNQHMIATSHEDNSLQILGPQMKGIKCVIEGLSLGVTSDYELSTGLLWNRKMRSIAMNGRVGHIQFYSPAFQKQLFQLDVVSQNLISSTRDFKVYPTEVRKAAVSSDGLWLSTLEMRDDFETLPEIRLKFWELKDSLKNYFLNTTIHLPHKSEVNCLEFSSDSEAMVSTSTDREFKIWHLVEDDDKKWWKCFKVGNLNSVSIPTIAKWSSDSSLLAIAFDNFITLWDVFEKSVLKFMTKLSVEEKSDSKLIFIDFGVEDKCHLLIEGRHYLIKIWNLLDLNVVWTLQTSETISSIALNKWENKLAVISDRFIKFFGLDSDQQIGTVVIKTRDQRMISAIFTDETPETNDSDCEPVFVKTKFYCLNEKQELFLFGQNEKHFVKTQIMEWDTDEILSPIALMLINKKQRNENLNKEDLDSYFISNQNITKLVDDMFFNVPSHVLPPINILSKTFLQSLNNCRQKPDIKNNNDFKSPNDFDISIKPLLSVTYDYQSDIQSNSTNLDTNERELETKDILFDEDIEDVNDFVEEDYSWLKELTIKNK